MVNIICRLEKIKKEYIECFKIECDELDIKSNPEAKKLAKEINKKVRTIDKCLNLLKEY